MVLHIKNVEESLTDGLMNELDLRTHGWPKLASWEKWVCLRSLCMSLQGGEGILH